jgi:hypothetical protein
MSAANTWDKLSVNQQIVLSDGFGRWTHCSTPMLVTRIGENKVDLNDVQTTIDALTKLKITTINGGRNVLTKRGKELVEYGTTGTSSSSSFAKPTHRSHPNGSREKKNNNRSSGGGGGYRKREKMLRAEYTRNAFYRLQQTMYNLLETHCVDTNTYFGVGEHLYNDADTYDSVFDEAYHNSYVIDKIVHEERDHKIIDGINSGNVISPGYKSITAAMYRLRDGDGDERVETSGSFSLSVSRPDESDEQQWIFER